MKVHLIGTAFVLVAMMAAAGLLVLARQTPQLEGTDLPTPLPSSSPIPSPLPTPALSDVEIRITPAPATPVQTAAPSETPFEYAINLNTDIQMYPLLSLPPDVEQALLDLRCAPAVPPETPYPDYLEGCGANAAGIMFLDDIVEAGIMTVEEVDLVLADKVFQTWRGR